MKKIIIYIFILILAIVTNIYYLKIDWFSFIGLFLAVLLVYTFLSNFIIKFYKNKKGIKQEDYSYAFPDKMAKMMKKVDMRTQLEASLLSMFFILIGMLAMDIYIVFFLNYNWWFKGLILFNSFFAMIFLTASLIGQYQSYVTYMQTIDNINNDVMTINLMKGGTN
jgi:hypothetical protein